MASADWKVQIVDSSGDADYSVSVVGDQVVDLSGAAPGDALVIDGNGLVVPADPYVEKAGDTMTGDLILPAVKVTGAAGMSNINPLRMLGILNHAGPPVGADGTFAVGDCVFDSNAQEWVCTVAGSPGTWIAVGSGRTLGSSNLQTPFTMTTAATPEDVPGWTVSFTYDGRSVRFVVWAPSTSQDQAATKLIQLSIKRSSDSVTQWTGFRQTDAVANTLGLIAIDSGPVTGWADATPFVVGTTYAAKMHMTSGASSKGKVGGTWNPFYVITA